jgi:hypothetical protein
VSHLLRRRAPLIATALVAVLLALIVPSGALATPGDDPTTAISLPTVPWSQDVTGTTLPLTDPESGETYYGNWYAVSLTKGVTYAFTGSAEDEGFFLLLQSASFSSPGVLASDFVSQGVGRLTVMAPRTGLYYLTTEGSAVESYTISASLAPRVKYAFKGFSAPKSAKKNKAFTLSVQLTPDYDSLFSPVTFEVQKYSSSYKAYKKFASKLGDGDQTQTPFSASIKLPKGSYRIRPTFSDASGVKVSSPSWKKITVK